MRLSALLVVAASWLVARAQRPIAGVSRSRVGALDPARSRDVEHGSGKLDGARGPVSFLDARRSVSSTRCPPGARRVLVYRRNGTDAGANVTQARHGAWIKDVAALSESFGRHPAAGANTSDYCSNLPCVIRTRDAHVAELVTRCRPSYEYQVVDTVRHVVKPPPALKHTSNRTPSLKTIVVYSGPTTLKQPLYLDNFEYFLKHGLPSSRHGCSLDVTVIVVLTKATLSHYATQISQHNASCGEIRTKVREDRCYDMESARVAMASGLLFDKLVFLNCGLKGPFQSAPSFWAAEFTTRLNADVKFTGMTINCGGKLGVHHAHVQSMIWATDRVGLASIQKAGAIYDCKDQLSKANGRAQLIVNYELGMSRAVMKDGYAIQDLTNRTFHWAEAQKQRCGDLWGDAHLWEKFPPSKLIFWKVSRGAQKYALSQWAASSGSHELHKKLDRDATCYADRYPDLRAAFCKGGTCDAAKLGQHWDQHRAHEIRVFGCGAPRPECCTRGAAECLACMQK